MVEADSRDLRFDSVSVATLSACPADTLDALGFGVVGLTSDGRVKIFNATEARMAGIAAGTILDTHFFTNTAQCMNNFMVAQRFEDEPRIDDTIDYVLTLRMRPTPVRLRLLKEPDAALSFILVLRT